MKLDCHWSRLEASSALRVVRSGAARLTLTTGGSASIAEQFGMPANGRLVWLA